MCGNILAFNKINKIFILVGYRKNFLFEKNIPNLICR